MPIAKRKKVEVFQHSTFRNVTVDIYLTREMKFQAEFAEQKFEETDGTVLKQKLSKAIDEANEIQWIHVMEIQHTNRTHGEHQHGLEIKIDDFWATAHQNNYWRANQAAYDCELEKDDRFPDDRPFGMRLLGRAGVWRDHYTRPVTMENICTSRHEEGSDSGGIILNDDELSIVLPFDQQLYDGVMGICQGIAAANARIRQLLGTPEGLRLVANTTLTLLGTEPSNANNTTDAPQHAGENLPESKGPARRRR